MDVFFNDLSVNPNIDRSSVPEIVDAYAKVVKKSLEEGFKTVRYENGISSIVFENGGYPIAQYFNENSFLPAVNLILSKQTRPYITDEKDEDVYILNDYVVEHPTGEVKSEGLTAAAICNSMSIGFLNSDWSNHLYRVREVKSSMVSIVNYAFDDKGFETPEYQSWADKHLPPSLIETTILPEEKKIHLSPHHGYDILYAFAKKIRKESYVTAIINSIDRDSNEKVFARPGSGEGVVNITLIDNGGYGIAVATTARNERELKHVIKLLTEKYG